MLPSYLVWATVFTGPHPNRPILAQVTEIQNFILAKYGCIIYHFTPNLILFQWEPCYLSHKLLIHHVIAFASGEEGL